MADQAKKKNYQTMLYWKNILQYILLGVYAIYLSSLIITWLFYPAGPIYDLETDEIIGHQGGITWWNFAMLALFSVVNNWGYNQINKSNEMGVTPSFCLDVFGFNLFVMVSYSFTNKALKIYYLVPIYGLYKAWVTLGPYISMLCP